MPEQRDFRWRRRGPPWWSPGGSGQAGRSKPPWWPADTPFPPQSPQDEPAVGAIRRRFFWRFGAILLLLGLLGCAVFTLLFWVIALSFNIVSVPAGINFVVRPLGFGALLLGIVIALGTFRTVRRAIIPLSDVVSAAEQVTQGDYTIRVEPRGPREVRSLAQAFNEMTARLQSNDAQRRSLLADVSHELRTPLTVIQGNLEGMLDGVYPLDHAHLEPVLEETRQLARIIEDLRTLALAESGALHLKRESTDVPILINEVVTSFRAQAEGAGVALTITNDARVPNLNVDPARIRQVLENLIYNALRFTANGGEVRVTCDLDTGKNVLIAVKDTGRGIPAEELPHIFERFYKANDSRGTGLGLPIAKSLAEAHGGAIFAESTPGQGTRIWFTLPI